MQDVPQAQGRKPEPPRTVFEFIDYRKYLAHYYAEQKRHSRKFSYRFFAARAGITSPSFLKSVIDGKRNLTSPMLEKFSEALRLGAREAKYFHHLVRFNQARTAREKQEHYAILRFLGSPAFEEVLDSHQEGYWDAWQTPIIRELLCLRDFREDWGLLGRMVQPPIPAEEACAAVRQLVRLGLVARRADGRYVQTRKGIAADGNRASPMVRAFHARMLEHARHALAEVDRRERHMSSLTLSVTGSSYAALLEEIKAFKERVKTIVQGEEGGNRVYQFNLDLFPMSRDLERAGLPGGPRA